VSRPVGLLDVLPTALSVAGMAPPPGRKGTSLLDRDSKAAIGRRIYSETLYPRLALGWSELFSLEDARFQYIEAPRPELYDLVADPGERRDLSSGRPDPFRSMRAELEKIPRVEASPENATPEELEKLGSLGYLSVTRGRPGEPLPDPKDRIASLPKYKRLFELYYARQDERVLPLAAEILAEEPGMVSVWKMRAGSRERLGDLKGAAEDLESALVRSPNASAEQKSEIVEKLARVLVRADERARAERVLRDAIAGPYANDSMRLALSQLLAESGRPDEAARVLPPESPSEDAATADARGVSAAEAGRLDEARRHFLAALQREPANATALLHLGMLSLREKDAGAARSWFEKSLASQPDAPGTLSALGLAQVQLGDAAGAFASWSRAVELDPRQYDTLFNLAVLAGRTGREAEARRALEQYLATAPASKYSGQRAEAQRLLRSLPPQRK